MRGNLIKVLSLVKYLLLVLLLIFIVGLMQGDKIRQRQYRGCNGESYKGDGYDGSVCR